MSYLGQAGHESRASEWQHTGPWCCILFKSTQIFIHHIHRQQFNCQELVGNVLTLWFLFLAILISSYRGGRWGGMLAIDWIWKVWVLWRVGMIFSDYERSTKQCLKIWLGLRSGLKYLISCSWYLRFEGFAYKFIFLIQKWLTRSSDFKFIVTSSKLKVGCWKLEVECW